MRLSALLLTLVIALGLSGPLEARTRRHKAHKPKVHHNSAYKAPKHKQKPPKVKRAKPPKVHKQKPRTV